MKSATTKNKKNYAKKFLKPQPKSFEFSLKIFPIESKKSNKILKYSMKTLMQ